MLASDPLSYLRGELSDTDTSGSGRWTDTQLLQFIDRTNKELVDVTKFPDSRITQLTIPNQQLYQFPLMLSVRAIYVDGQMIVPSDLNTLEGVQINMYDNTANGQTTPVSGGDYPIGSTGTGGPQWAAISPLSYPSTNGQWVYPAPDAQPSNPYQRPRFYWRGGFLGLVPAPAGVATIELDGVRQPDTIAAQGQILTTPDNYMDALVWGAGYRALLAEHSKEADASAQIWKGEYKDKVRQLLRWRGMNEGEQRNGPKPLTLRAAYGRWHTRRRSNGYGGRGWGV
jgi:hypothetical protein